MNSDSTKISRRTFFGRSGIGLGAASALLASAHGLLCGAGEEPARIGAIVLLGPPGAGKSVQGRKLSEKHSIPVISTGDLLRDHVKRGTALGLQADPYMKAGKLVPDSLMTPILEDRLSQADCARGFVLDGYPRTLAQANGLDALLARKGIASRIVLLDVPAERVLKLLAGRRVCPRCNRSYNIHFQPPKKEGVCDDDGEALVQRADDKEEVILKRMETYRKETQPVINWYSRQTRLIRIHGAQTPEQVAAEVESKLAPK